MSKKHKRCSDAEVAKLVDDYKDCMDFNLEYQDEPIEMRIRLAKRLGYVHEDYKTPTERGYNLGSDRTLN